MNDFDGNLTLGVARIEFRNDGSLSGCVDWTAGTNYNIAESAPIVGNFGPTMPTPGPEWTTFDPATHNISWSERYHQGYSTFYYNGVLVKQGD